VLAPACLTQVHSARNWSDHRVSVAIAIDVGGTKIAGGLVRRDGTLLHHQVVPTPRTSVGSDPGAEATLSLVDELFRQAAESDVKIIGVGIGVPEYVTPLGEITGTDVLAWSPGDLDELGSRVELTIESDVRCGALGEAQCGHGRQVDSMVYVSIGTGISHALALDGQIWRGHRGEAIALGELPVSAEDALLPDEPLTLERQASGRTLESLLGDSGAKTRSASAENAITQAGQLVAASLVSLVHLLDPELIVLGGGIGSTEGPYSNAVITRAKQLLRGRPHSPPILRSKLGAQAGLIGAGLAAHEPAGHAYSSEVR
jgi:glucokinase